MGDYQIMSNNSVSNVRKNTLRGYQYDCHTGEKTLRTDIEYEIRDTSFWLLNGVTGYESFTISAFLKDINDADFDENSVWVACMGTKDRYHKLEIPISELKKALSTQFKENSS